MSKKRSEETRKIQRHGSGNKYYRMTLPPEFAENKDEVQLIYSDDRLIIQSNSQTESTTQTVHLEDIQWDGQLDLYLLLEFIPSWGIADYNKIDIERPDDRRTERKIHNFLKSAQEKPFLDWDREKFRLELKKYEYIEFVKDIDDFLDLHFMDTLEGISKLEELSRDFNGPFLTYETWDQWDRPHSVIHDDEQRIDTLWSLTSKEAASSFNQFKLDRYPEAIGNIHVANKLERAVDHAFVILALLRDAYEYDSKKTKNFRDDLLKVFEDPRFNSQVREIGLDCVTGNVTTQNIIKQKKKFNQRQKLLYNIYKKYIGDGNIILGQIISQCYELIRCPRSVAIAGLGGKYATRDKSE